jgi:hypothetical protein
MNNSTFRSAAAIGSVLIAVVCFAETSMEFEFRLADDEVSLHEPVRLDLTIRNRSTKRVEVDLGHNARSNLAFVVTTPDGTRHVLPRPAAQGLGISGEVTLEPGQSHTERYLLNEWFPFPLAGTYTIEAALSGRPRLGHRSITTSAPQILTLIVAPRDEKRLEAVVRQLATTAIHEKNAEKQMVAANALSLIDDPVAVPHLIQLLRSRSWSRAEAARGLARIATPAALAALVDALNDPDPEFRAVVHWHLEQARKRGGQS